MLPVANAFTTLKTLNMKTVRYKGVQVIKPDNISISLFKRVVDELGKDYCITVNSIIQFLSKEKLNGKKD